MLFYYFSSFLDLSSLNSLPVTSVPDSRFPLSGLREGCHLLSLPVTAFETKHWWNKVINGDDGIYPFMLCIHLLGPVVYFQGVYFLDNESPLSHFEARPMAAGLRSVREHWYGLE